MGSNSTDLFWTDWRKFHGELWPVGWALRQSQLLPWLRLHALPESKRYAQNHAEQRIILDRAYELAEHIIGESELCWQVTASYGNWLPSSENVMLIDDENEHEASGLHFDAISVQWGRGAYDAILTDIADDKTPHILWFGPSKGSIFAPYDGGFDLFPRSHKHVEDYRNLYSEWLSKHPEGL